MGVAPFEVRKHRPARRQAQAPADGVGSALEEVHRMRIRPLPLLAVALVAASVEAVELDRAAVDFKTPAEIRWVRNAAGTNEQAHVIHYGGKVHYDGAKDEETIIPVWGMGPATATPAEKK
jgi:hypothetical protein